MSLSFQSYLLRPLDTLFFRGGEPFNAGDDHFVQSQFPPTPRTLQGIIRTKLLQDNAVDLGNQLEIGRLVGTGDQLPDDLQFRGPFPSCNCTPWFPAPRYLGRDVKGGWHRLVPCDDLLSDMGSALVLPVCPPPGLLTPVGGWIAWPLMRWVLWGEGSPDRVSCWSEATPLWKEEIRTGIARDAARKTARQQHLYSIGHIRLKPETALWFQTTRELTQGVMPVGGEGRLAAFKEVKEPQLSDLSLPDDVAQAICQEGRFWLVLVQPARFNSGWRPDFSQTDQADLQGLQVELVTAVVGKPQPIGGFDLIKKRPNDLFRYVPAGSAYLLKFAGNAPNDAPARLQRLHNSCALGEPNERRMGFGHVMIGKVLEDRA